MSLVKKEKGQFPTFDTLWGSFFNDDFFNRGLQLGTSIPAVNVSETDTSYHLEAAIPGYDKKDFNIDIEKGVLTISSEKKDEKEEKDGKKVTRREYSYSSFSRSFALPENVDDHQIKANYSDGILTIDIPKKSAEPAGPKRSVDVH